MSSSKRSPVVDSILEKVYEKFRQYLSKPYITYRDVNEFNNYATRLVNEHLQEFSSNEEFHKVMETITKLTRELSSRAVHPVVKAGKGAYVFLEVKHAGKDVINALKKLEKNLTVKDESKYANPRGETYIRIVTDWGRNPEFKYVWLHTKDKAVPIGVIVGEPTREKLQQIIKKLTEIATNVEQKHEVEQHEIEQNQNTEKRHIEKHETGRHPQIFLDRLIPGPVIIWKLVDYPTPKGYVEHLKKELEKLYREADLNKNKMLDIGDAILFLKKSMKIIREAVPWVRPELKKYANHLLKNLMDRILGIPTLEDYKSEIDRYYMKDLNHNGKIDIGDIILFLKKAREIISKAPRSYRRELESYMKELGNKMLKHILYA